MGWGTSLRKEIQGLLSRRGLCIGQLSHTNNGSLNALGSESMDSTWKSQHGQDHHETLWQWKQRHPGSNLVKNIQVSGRGASSSLFLSRHWDFHFRYCFDKHFPGPYCVQALCQVTRHDQAWALPVKSLQSNASLGRDVGAGGREDRRGKWVGD